MFWMFSLIQLNLVKTFEIFIKWFFLLLVFQYLQTFNILSFFLNGWKLSHIYFITILILNIQFTILGILRKWPEIHCGTSFFVRLIKWLLSSLWRLLNFLNKIIFVEILVTWFIERLEFILSQIFRTQSILKSLRSIVSMKRLFNHRTIITLVVFEHFLCFHISIIIL